MSSNAVLLEHGTELKSDQAYRFLEEMIVTLELRPGALLSESRLVEHLNLGRTPVREALQRLASEGLVDIMPRRGIRITDIDVKQQSRLLEVRRELEGLSIRLCARRADPTQKEEFLKIAEDLEQVASSKDYLTFLHLDRDLNALIPTVADNEFAARMLQQIHGLSRRFWHRHYLKRDDLREVATLHAAIARAIAKGDEGAAAAASKAHMDYIQSFTLSALDLQA